MTTSKRNCYYFHSLRGALVYVRVSSVFTPFARLPRVHASGTGVQYVASRLVSLLGSATT